MNYRKNSPYTRFENEACYSQPIFIILISLLLIFKNYKIFFSIYNSFIIDLMFFLFFFVISYFIRSLLMNAN